jgi:GNAT superfamily N-acetyltransferase
VAVVLPVEPAHVEAFASLAEEMDRFYGATGFEPLESRVQQINQALFADPPSAYALIAWDGDRPVAFATYSFLWPAVGLTRSLYLKELYVREPDRRSGVGRDVMRALFELAVKVGCSRVEWTTDQENLGAQAFYATVGVERNAGKLFYRLEGDELRRAAEAD